MSHLYGCLIIIGAFLKIIIHALLIFLQLLVIHSYAHATDIQSINITENAGIYHISISADIDAPAQYVRQVINDHAHAYRINNSIIESEVLETLSLGNKKVRTRMLCCTVLFCQEAERVDIVRTLKSGDISATIIPGDSDFHSGQALFKLTEKGCNHTYLTYSANIEPRFFIPPVIGPKVVIESLKEQFTNTFIRIEKVAQIEQEREWNDNYKVAKPADKSATQPCDDTSINTTLR